MTTITMIENIHKMLDETIRICSPADSAAENNIRNMLLSPGFSFGDTLNALQADLRKEQAKKSGKSTQTAAAGRIIKNAIKVNERRPAFHGAWIAADGKQYLTDGYRMVRYAEALPLPEAEGAEGLERNMTDAAMQSGQPLDLPSIADIKAEIAAHKAKHADIPAKRRPACMWDFGEGLPAVNAQYLIDMMQALPDAKATWTKATSPIYFTDSINDGILLPIRKA